MAYLVLARKYRPERFSEVIGQTHITRTLANAITHDRVHHAYMFCGVRGLGKTTVARILAKCLVCEAGPTPEPCNVCSQCVAIREGRSTDVVEIDAASNNGVDHIRRLREQVQYLPQSARRKIYIIDEVHMLSNQAFNALLKTLEEPPEHVTFLFATTDPHKVLPTILSRVNRLDLRRVEGEVLVEHLERVLEREGFAAEPAALRMISRAAEGSVRDALTLLDEVIAFAEDPTHIDTGEARMLLGHADRFAVGELVAAVLERDPGATLERFDEIARTASDLGNVALGVLQHLRDLAIVKATGARGALLDVSDAVFEQLEAQAAALEHERVAQLFDRFSRIVEGLERSASPRLVLEMGLLDLAHAEALAPLGELVARVEAAAARARGSAPHPGGSGGSGGGGPSPTSGARGARGDRGGPPPARSAPAEAPAPAPSTSSMPPQAPIAGQAREASEASDAPTPSGGSEIPSARAPRGRAQQTVPTPSPPAGSLSEQLWQMMQPASSRGEAHAPHREQDTPHREQDTPARAEPPEPPSSRVASDGPAFSLAPPSAEPAPEPEPEPPRAQVDPEAGCPSSRCTPRPSIPWQTLEPFAAWEALLEQIRGEDELLFAVLSELGLVALETARIELAAPRGSFARQQLDEELRARLEAHLRDAFGEAFTIHLHDAVSELPDRPSLELVEAGRRERHRARIDERARQHPQIRALVEHFGAQIERIEALGRPPRDEPTPPA